MAHSVASCALIFASSFEAEVFVALLLEKWRHPLSSDEQFKNDLLEGAAEVLQASARGETVLAGIKPYDVNFIAALWYAEWNSLQSLGGTNAEKDARMAWLNSMRRALPSCFCDPADLSP